MIDTVRPIRINVIGSTSRKGVVRFYTSAWPPRWRRHLAGGRKMLHNQPRLNTFHIRTPDEIMQTNLHLCTTPPLIFQNRSSHHQNHSLSTLSNFPLNHTIPMARSKRVPLQRQPSDFTAAPPNPDEGWKTGAVNGSIPVEKRQIDTRTTDTSPQEMLADVIPTEQAGLTHLLICVGGIYASL